MKIQVFNELEIQRVVTEEKHIVISIQDPSCEFVTLPNQSSRLDYLGLKFYDIDDVYISNFDEWCNERKITGFNKNDAKLILDFVMKWKDKIDLILVNCCSGISRSSAIAGALSKILNGNDEFYFKHYIPNRLVYRYILEEYYETK
jgi:predicted protein tyrosine phosphatase